MGTLADSAIVAGTLIFLLGVVWLTTAMHRSYQRRTPATITVLGLVVTNTGGILYPFGGINTQFGSTPVCHIGPLGATRRAWAPGGHCVGSAVSATQ